MPPLFITFPLVVNQNPQPRPGCPAWSYVVQLTESLQYFTWRRAGGSPINRLWENAGWLLKAVLRTK
ncbi:MAG: hypothetical protein LBJ67_05105 [Planctomycetaceae bacterium]|nr:hypothetical protein [Planctomycetaceae bacterium]